MKHLLLLLLCLFSIIGTAQISDSTFNDGGLDLFSKAYHDVSQFGYKEGEDSLLIWMDLPIVAEVFDFFELKSPMILDSSAPIEFYLKRYSTDYFVLEFEELFHEGDSWKTKYNVYQIEENKITLLSSYAEEVTQLSENSVEIRILWHWISE
ncbi:hypothetical protein [Phaeocystidibacter marisrubri]|uniref:Uncharacterized protein n=1 Tax=Phaeocystidibacter marisrubri TaxID=1577780 RepID=A0A6L3ZIN5_9FLAO|nr:hypothetical protein [Phaeocystidibacter marisrubri]KAB2817473.1 hypothetical protein F8C82_03490 [Phaeocystidibacter marisrubri]